jgi:hypothetical protein
MSTDNLFVIIMFIGVYVMCLLLLDGAHKAHIAALKHAHYEQVAGLRTYIRTLSRERMWLEAELQRVKDKLEQRQNGEVQAAPEHIQWMPGPKGSPLPPSEEYDEQ